MVEERLRLARLPGAQAAFLKALRGFVGPGGFEPERVAELPSWLPAVAAPTLVVWGREDRFVPVAHARVLEQHLPQCRVVVYPHCGHLPQLEQPERLNGDLLAFLAEIDGRAAGRAALH
jgi:4,5:9,10-diseco-3-hydroxy-5,9,17-trioxoandrosta-1(10),2-diene-4-oate hydrolase